MDEVFTSHGDDLSRVPWHGTGFLGGFRQDGRKSSLYRVKLNLGLSFPLADGAFEDVYDEIRGFF
jgi:hypothetical protein